MSDPKTQKLPLYIDTSLLVSEYPANDGDIEVHYMLVESESVALDKVFNTIFEKVNKRF
jgi:hypothetical protein